MLLVYKQKIGILEKKVANLESILSKNTRNLDSS